MPPSSDPAFETSLLRPAEAAERLGIPASTLRRWSRRFAAFLSPQANGLRGEEGARGHRRYTPEDIAVLARCKALLSEGYTFDQVAEMLKVSFQPEVQVVEGEVEMTTEDESRAGTSDRAEERGEMTLGEDAVDLGKMMAQMIAALSGSQKMIITGQQTERELLGILIQDNLNLKEENKRLRERMVETERRIFELKREMERHREEERERMRQMEAYMFQLQRQLDDLTRRPRTPTYPLSGIPTQPPMPSGVKASPSVAQVQTPPPTKMEAPDPAPQPLPEQTEQISAPPSQPENPTPSRPKKRSFLDWLFGR